MKDRNRREFLISTGAGIAAGLIAAPARAQSGAAASKAAPRIRKSVTSAAAKGDLASLSKGVGEMRALIKSAPSDPRGWIMQAFIHGDCNGFTKCQHRSWFFAPWHRSLLSHFEQLIQHFSGDAGFALPYWDWSRNTGVPASFYGAGNPLDDTVSIRSSCASAPTAGRGRLVTERFSQQDFDQFIGPVVVNRIQQNPDYATYGGSATAGGELEGTLHNFIHRWVGGTTKFSNMVRAYSPLDPIFWLHHCNIDRLYSNWLARPNHNPPSDATWQKTSFNDFFDADGKPAGGDLTCAGTLDSTTLGYVYDVSADKLLTLKPSAAAGAGAGAIAGGAAAERVVSTVVAATVSKQAGVLSFVSASALPEDTQRSMAATALGVRDYSARLRLEGIKVPARQNTSVQVFIGPDIRANTPITAPGYVGSFTFFEGDPSSDPAHAHGPHNLLLNATDALRRLYGDTSLPAGTGLTVSIVTRPLYTGVTAFGTVEEVQPERVQLDVVTLNS